MLEADRLPRSQLHGLLVRLVHGLLLRRAGSEDAGLVRAVSLQVVIVIIVILKGTAIKQEERIILDIHSTLFVSPLEQSIALS